MSSPTNVPPHPQTNPPENTVTDQPHVDLTETQKAYNVAQSEMFAIAAWGHHRYFPRGESLTDEGKRQERDYNDRIRAARDELEAALLRLVAEHGETYRTLPAPVVGWLRTLADDPAELSLLAVRPDERDFDTAPADPVALRDRIAEALYALMLRNGWGGERTESVVREMDLVLDAVLGVLPAPVDRAAVLTPAERTMLTYALDQAQEHIWSRDGFTDEDQAAVDSLRRLTAECPQCGDTGACNGGPCPLRPAVEAELTPPHPPRHRWYVETLDSLANEWAPGTRFLNRARAADRYTAQNERYPKWKDGSRVRRRLVRETTTYTVEESQS